MNLKIERSASFNHGTTAKVEYRIVDVVTGKLIHTDTKLKSAKEWLDVLTLSQEEVFAKYPHLRA